METGFFIKPHGAFIKVPNLQRHAVAMVGFCFFFHKLIKRQADVLAPAGGIHAQVVDKKYFSILQGSGSSSFRVEFDSENPS